MVTPRFHPEVGGVERHVREVGRRLVQHGCEVTVLCTDRSGSLPITDVVDGIEVRRVRAWPRRRDLYLAPGVWKEMTRKQWDLVHVQSYHTFVAPLAMLRALTLRRPFVLTFHGGGHSSSLRRALRRTHHRAIRSLVRRASRLVAIARFEIPMYGRVFSVPPDRFVLIPNGCDTVPGDVPSSAASSTPVIASIGRLERYKGHQRLLAAFPEILRVLPDAEAWIVGSGPEQAALCAQARSLNVQDRVRFRSVPSDRPGEMASLMQAASLIVCLSDFESHPLVAVEAAALGRPLLVTATSGLQELAEDGWATAIPLDSSTHTIAAAVVQQLTNPCAIRPAQPLPTWDDCTKQLLALYEQTHVG
jgi:glycosyltransferase involved in cell wall biosynthesis